MRNYNISKIIGITKLGSSEKLEIKVTLTKETGRKYKLILEIMKISRCSGLFGE